MVIGSRNILEKIQAELSICMEKHPDYSILVTGYSLGAGICQLVAMSLQASEEISAQVRCISYGAPLVFQSDIDSESDFGSNLFTVVCSHDGLASASLCTLSKLLSQIRAVEGLQLRKRDMIKMLMTSVQAEDGTELKEEDDSEDDEDFDKDKLAHKPTFVLTPEWEKIQTAINEVEVDDTKFAKLTHPAKNIFIFKRRACGEVVTRYFQDNCLEFAENLRLRGSMFSHHMPWSYKSLFAGYNLDQEAVSPDLVKSVLNLN